MILKDLRILGDVRDELVLDADFDLSDTEHVHQFGIFARVNASLDRDIDAVCERLLDDLLSERARQH